jgi:hypothetical protein
MYGTVTQYDVPDTRNVSSFLGVRNYISFLYKVAMRKLQRYIFEASGFYVGHRRTNNSELNCSEHFANLMSVNVKI